MINKNTAWVQEQLWNLCKAEIVIVSALSGGELSDLKHRAEELSSHAEASWRMTAEIIKSACNMEMEKRK